jgi:hypothetical protein
MKFLNLKSLYDTIMSSRKARKDSFLVNLMHFYCFVILNFLSDGLLIFFQLYFFEAWMADTRKAGAS